MKKHRPLSLLSYILLAALLLAAVPFSAVSADPPAYTLSGGVLTVDQMPSGSSAADYPWYGMKNKTKKVILQPGIDALSCGAFEGYPNLEEIIFSGDCTTVCERALADCPMLERIYFQAPVVSIGRAAFLGSSHIGTVVLTDQSKHDFLVYASLSPYNLAVNGGVATGLDSAFYTSFSSYVTWYDSENDLTDAGKLAAAADTNYDNTVNIRDVTTLLNRLTYPDLDWTGRLNDVDQSGNTSIGDVTSLVDYLSGICVHSPEALDARAPTCTVEGYEPYVRCALCYVELTVKTEIAKEDHVLLRTAAIAPGCTTTGYTEGVTCAVCGTVVLERTALPALGHDFGAWTIYEPPTCNREGARSRTCARCGETENEALVKIPHTPVSFGGTAPTCTEEGATEGSRCAVCGAILTPQTAIPALGHTPVTDRAVEPTCYRSGHTEGSHCSVCGETLIATSSIPKLDHFYENGACIYCGAQQATISGFRMEAINGGTEYRVKEFTYDTEVFEGTVLVIPDTYNGLPVTEIGEYAFSSALQNGNGGISVIIPEGIRIIRQYAFSYCGRIREVTLPNSLTSIEYAAFNNCPGIRSIYFNGTPEDWLSIDFSFPQLFSRSVTTKTNLYFYGALVSEVVIPNGYTTVPAYAFDECASISRVVIPEGVESIGESAFTHCPIEDIYIPVSVTSIGSYALYGSINNLHYAGTEEEWNAITFGKYWGVPPFIQNMLFNGE